MYTISYFFLKGTHIYLSLILVSSSQSHAKVKDMNVRLQSVLETLETVSPASGKSPVLDVTP